MNELAPGQILWPLLTVAVSIASIGSVVVGAIKLGKRIPPLPEELAKVYATKVEVRNGMEAINARIDREIQLIRDTSGDTSEKLDALITTTNHNAMNTERALGRIEGKLDAHLREKHEG